VIQGDDPHPLVIPGPPALLAGGTRLRRQDAGANIGVADGPQGEPQDAASLSSTSQQNRFRVPSPMKPAMAPE
jgi:hypothetical protein